MKGLKSLFLIGVLVLFSIVSYADVWKGQTNPKPTPRSTGGCEPGKTSTELAYNNVRALIHTGGDMWWDLQGKAKYEVPKGGGVSALFAGAIWVGGKDANGQLKLAAQRFRQDGIDYWPGPLITSGPDQASVSREICRTYDKHFVITKDEVKKFREWWACTNDPDCTLGEDFADYQIPDIILNWPAHGPAGGYDYYLAPFWDVDGDGYYNPLNGDFPYYEFPNEGITDDPDCIRPRNRKPKLFGDYTLWWVYNDKGNVHTETGGASIGMEFRAQGFAFTTNDELNDMTFYNYNIINRSTYTLFNTYFGVWTDADLGYAKDDYTGCDIQRGLGYMYNGDDMDETAEGIQGYGKQPPSIGIDFFEGPYQDPDGVDNPNSYDTINGRLVLNCNKGDILNGNINGLNFGDGTIDNERWGMRRFLYFNNYGTGAHPATQDPHSAIEHYNYLTGFWKDNTPLCYGGTGHYAGGGDINTPTDFMFPGKPTTDPCGWGQGGIPKPDWSEETEQNPAGDRRFVQSAGPFTLTPGQVNDITLGAVYARAPSGGPWASVEAVRRADDKAQILFENCFRVLDGPDAPELKIIEMDRKLIFHIYNKPSSNNYLEAYIEKDPSIVCGGEISPCDEYYRFQGYQVFQLKDKSVSISDRYNNALVREVFQCDIKDGVSQLVNYYWSDELQANIPVQEVNGTDNGIVHTFVIEYDKFASGDTRLINHREYYFTALAYGYNASLRYNQTVQETFLGQKKPYIAGRNNIKTYKAIPHINTPENNGTILQSEYGDGVEITMLEGHGNGNQIIDLSEETINQIMSGYPWKVDARKYVLGRGPINVKIIDPLNVPEDEYELRFVNIDINSYGLCGSTNVDLAQSLYKPFDYILINSKGDTIYSEVKVPYGDGYEQLFLNYGFSITISQKNFAGYRDRNDFQNGFLEATIEFKDPTKPWLLFLPDGDGFDEMNWIRVGTYKTNETGDCADKSWDDIIGWDDQQIYEKILNGTWAPFRFVNSGRYGFALEGARNFQKIERFEPLSSVDLVITSDTSKWTRCCIVEMSENEWIPDPDCPGLFKLKSPWVNYLSKGNALKYALRKDPSVDKMGNPDNSGTYGMGWFPGYAIDVRTGRRLNIIFGEDSWLIGDNGGDMKWNPTSKIYSQTGPVFGGKHVIYIMGDNQNFTQAAFNAPHYDSCKWIYENLKKYDETGVAATSLNRAWAAAMWVSIPLQNPNFDFLATDVKIRLRVAGPYHKGMNEFAVMDSANVKNDNFPLFKFHTRDVKTIKSDNPTAVNALDIIRVVPNPYYGNSYYENTQLDNYVKITNLPEKCIISIYNINGTLIRQFNKDNKNTYLTWDLKNTYGISIASGVYIIHINAPGIGEKVIKWFGALRPIDLNNF
ncbi:MAG TPA: T9SS type A sorting domain-containing protein [Bacteroidales bacterium]|nr:T9SS type A sorting domain-containing protein [Bacteroidales bacterium]HOL98098.1 T9SS type A sorting domain-containing protein [Bacteroidales bacterium]HUM32474.1 T9SS type A sorting domain-containing protein [Bacteroidales bacterium]